MASQATRPDLRDCGLLRDKAFVAGEWRAADDGATFAVTNPAPGEALCEGARRGRGETRRAIAAAGEAFPAWRDRPAAQRAALLSAFADLMLEHRDDLALLLTLEQGKPQRESEAEIAYAASFLQWFGEEA